MQQQSWLVTKIGLVVTADMRNTHRRVGSADRRRPTMATDAMARAMALWQ